jgi:cell division septation protein DedD
MGLTKRSFFAALLVLAVFLIPGNGMHAQNSGTAVPGQLGREIQDLEQRLAAGISPTERYELSSRLARFRQLSGDIAGAAANWLDAATANHADDAALVSAAYCLAAIGEWERALLTIRPLLISGRQGLPMLQARYLDASLRARASGDISMLINLANDPGFAAIHPLIFYTIWRISSENSVPSIAESSGRWRSRLVAEFPKSPEARAADTGKTGSVSVNVIQNPVWMLFPGTPALAEQPRPAAPSAAAPVTAPGTVNVTPAVVLQTGVFSREANARSQADALRRAGFSAAVSQKLVNGTNHWAVTVPAGQDTNGTIQALKRAGFDSFPVRIH